MIRGVKKILSVLVVLSLAVMLAACSHQEPREEILKVYNWGDYIDEDMLAKFPEWYREQTGKRIRVIYQTFDINEIMLTKIERGHEDYDVVCPSEYIIERMMRKDLLLPIDTCFGKTPNYIKRNISPYIVAQFDGIKCMGKKASDYAVGYMWGTAGILYNTAYVKRSEAQTWATLWNPKFKGKLLMKDSYRDCYGTALIYARRDDLKSGKTTVKSLMNDYSPQSIALVEKYMKRLKPNIEGWEADFGKETMTKGKALLNMTWSGDAVWAIEEAQKVGVKLDYQVPIEGSNVWFDGWVIPKYSRNPKVAAYFINYLCRSDVALANMETTGYVSSVATPEVLQTMDDSEAWPEERDLSYLFGKEGSRAHLNPIMYPSESTVARCAMIHDAADSTPQVLDMWTRVKGDNLGGGIAMFLILAFSIAAVWMGYKKYLRKKHRELSRKHRRHHVVKAQG